MQLIIINVISLVVLNTGIQAKTVAEEYSWRDFDGTIPFDAFAAGTDKNRENIYIGQTLFNNNLDAGKIIPRDRKMYYEYFSKEYSTDENVKIFCTSQPHKFQWYSTTASEVPRLDKIFVKGGFEPNVYMYLGRLLENGVANVGKIICLIKTNECYGMYTTEDNSTKLSTNFQILVFDPEVPSTSTTDVKYSWRDFEGVIPEDAFKAGVDENSRTIYIGQILFEDKLIPGKIVENDDKIYFEWYNKEESRKENVKILCTSQQDKFEWIRTNSKEVVRLKNTTLIIGGFEPKFNTYIGRLMENGANVGKVVCGVNDCFGLYTTNNGTGKLSAEFEVLSYNPNAPGIEDSTCNKECNLVTLNFFSNDC